VPFRDDVRYASGATHHLKGVPYELQVREAAVATVATEGTTLIVSVPAEADAGAVRLTLEAWYLDRAREHLPLRLAACWGVFEPGLPDPPSLRIRMMRSRWGSLSPAGAVTLNGYLMRAPSECIDAVIFHELCHLRVRGHGPDFYAELARYVPEWSRLRVELRGYRP
jgi:predicted metal-dependent hydrolase